MATFVCVVVMQDGARVRIEDHCGVAGRPGVGGRGGLQEGSKTDKRNRKLSEKTQQDANYPSFRSLAASKIVPVRGPYYSLRVCGVPSSATLVCPPLEGKVIIVLGHFFGAQATRQAVHSQDRSLNGCG